jgi:amidase
MSDDVVGAFVPGPRAEIQGAAAGALKGLRFAAKDLFDVAGYVTGGGNPAWAEGRTPATQHAWAVARLLSAGADLAGKTITDEVSLGILGENPFYGTPLNSAAPTHVPGGSSSGSAAAVAGGLVDIALGTDTGGSVRVPASFCGLYGIRPSHGRVPIDGMMAQAPSSDTIGWFARDAATFARVSAVMLADDGGTIPHRLVIAGDAFGFAEDAVQAALAPWLEGFVPRFDRVVEEIMAPPGLSVWGRAQRTLQPAEAWTTFRDWLDRDNPPLAFNVARGLIMGATVSDSDRQWAGLMRQEARARLRALVPPGTVLVMPTTPFAAPKKGLPLVAQNALREQILCLCAHGGLAGLPQINLPAVKLEDGRPVGVSLLASPGRDMDLIRLAEVLEAS